MLAQRQETLQGLALDSLAAGEAALEAARQAHAENQAAGGTWRGRGLGSTCYRLAVWRVSLPALLEGVSTITTASLPRAVDAVTLDSARGTQRPTPPFYPPSVVGVAAQTGSLRPCQATHGGVHSAPACLRCDDAVAGVYGIESR